MKKVLTQNGILDAANTEKRTASYKVYRVVFRDLDYIKVMFNSTKPQLGKQQNFQDEIYMCS